MLNNNACADMTTKHWENIAFIMEIWEQKLLFMYQQVTIAWASYSSNWANWILFLYKIYLPWLNFALKPLL